MPTVVHGDFEWDDVKAESNLAKHGVAFEEAALAMKDPLSWTSKTLWSRPM
ncbi:MAG: BrnT family toxin [Deltaproteobacteria bacterium]|nr:BrnT family toxin [Deltaproteobacteria bacterium]